LQEFDTLKFTIDLLNETIIKQEKTIASYANMVEATGRDKDLAIEGRSTSSDINGVS